MQQSPLQLLLLLSQLLYPWHGVGLKVPLQLPHIRFRRLQSLTIVCYRIVLELPNNGKMI
jgi:hypothetical protein